MYNEYDGDNEGEDHINRSNYTKYHTINKETDKSIRDELIKFKFPNNIVDKADYIYKNMKMGTRRGGKRKKLIYQCVRSAYDELGIPLNPKTLAEICCIRNSEISKASSLCSPVQTGYTSTTVIYKPIHFIKDSFEKLRDSLQHQIEFPSDTLEAIYEITNEITQVDENDEGYDVTMELLDEKPHMVAAAIILYYIELSGIKLDRKQYATLFKTSDMTINRIKNLVDAAYNI